MKAVQYLAPGKVEVVDADIPILSDGEVLVKIHAAGICGSDMSISSGNHPRATPPLTLGHEFAGEVVEINAGAAETEIEVGDKVTVFPLITCGECWACRNDHEHVCRTLRMTGIDYDGGMAQYAKIPLNLTCKLPQKLSYELGALIEPFAVGIHAVDMAQIQPDDFSVIMGAGPIGFIVAIALQHAGVKTILISDINQFRLDMAKNLGFDVIDASKYDVVEEIASRKNGEGADVVFEVAGSESSAMQMSNITRSRGKIILVSVHKVPHAVDLRDINFKEISLIGTRVYTRADYAEAIKIIDSTPLLSLVTHKMSLEQAPEAFTLMRNHDDVCKILLIEDY